MTKYYEMWWRNKYLTEDAKSLLEIAEKLEEAADYLQELHDTGKIYLAEYGDVGNDYAVFNTEDAKIAKKYGFEKPELY